jgi:uncharacterized protein (TIGR03083 family)
VREALGVKQTPRYGTDPVIVLDGSPADILEPVARQRRRLAAAVTSFTDEQWAQPSRCAGWSNRDVISHLDTTNGFWVFSITSGLRGEPSQLLLGFDPTATPAQLVAASEGVPTGQVLEQFLASTDALVDLLTSLDDVGWSTLAEAPPGHLSVSAVAHHALWDSWVHERDILLPLGGTPDEESDEIAASIRYVAALSPAMALNSGASERGAFAVHVTDPDLGVVVDIGDEVLVRSGDAEVELTLTGDAVGLLEALSIRAPLDQTVPPSTSWMVSGLAEAFATEP